MCGICGQYRFKNNNEVDPAEIRAMANAIAHRGPDDEGYFFDGPLGFGFRRLAIIDVEGGHQPMIDDENSIVVIFNGEIYNFHSLKMELKEKGHRFKTKSDTEVIVQGYKEWGIDVVSKLKGMFGMAVWDRRKKLLMLARDPAGIKQVYYKLESGTLYFGSEVRAISATIKAKPRVDLHAVSLFLLYRYIPSPFSLFQGIKKLAPGTRLVVQNGSAKVERWWTFRPEPFDPMPTAKEAEERLLELYMVSMRRHLISDVPLGLLLSGGVDSGLLLALMKHYGNEWNTYTVGFTNFSGDERNRASYTANVLKTGNVSLEIGKAIFEDTLPKIVGVLEEPVTASSVVPMYHICGRARQDVKVVLMGQGPDELFGGYPRHLGVQYGRFWRSVPEILRPHLIKIMNIRNRSEVVRRGLYALGTEGRFERYRKVFSIMPEEIIDALFRNEYSSLGKDDVLIDCWGDLLSLLEGTDELGGLQFLEIRSSLPDELLMYADKLSMAHGLEIRVPFLDLDIIEFVERLKSSYKVRFFSGKWLHKKICNKFLPKEIVRRKKIGFMTPINEWFLDPIGGKCNSLLKDPNSYIYDLLKYDSVNDILDNHQSLRSDNGKIIFSLVALEEWMRFYDVSI
jgi:asparagine synthase (glutamine-hydrolysing)